MPTDIKKFPLGHSVAFRFNERSYVQLGNVARGEVCLVPAETSEDWELIKHIEACWNTWTPMEHWQSGGNAPFLKISRDTLKSLLHLNPRMADLQNVSRHVTCCLCGAELGPQLQWRHWEFFEAEGPAKGELMIRVKGWSCLNTCKNPRPEDIVPEPPTGRQVEADFEEILSEMLGWNDSDSMKEYVEMLRRWKQAHDAGDAH